MDETGADHHDRHAPVDAAVIAVLICGFVFGAAIGLVLALLADIQDVFHLSSAQIGWAAGSAFVATAVSTVLVSPLADRGGERTLMVAGSALVAVGTICLALGSGFLPLIAGRIAAGVGYGAFLPAARRLVARRQRSRLSQALSWMVGAEVAGVIIGPALGALAANAWGLRAPFWILTAIITAAVCNLLVAFGRHPRPVGTANEPPAAALSWHSVAEILRVRPFVGALLLQLAIYVPVGIYDSLWARLLTDRGASTVFIGLSMLTFGLPIVFLGDRFGRMADLKGARRMANSGAWLLIPATALYGLTPTPGLTALLGVVEGIGQAAAAPAIVALMVSTGREESIAQGQSFGVALNQVAAGVGAAIAPVSYAAVGAGTMFGVAACLMALVWLCGMRFVGRSTAQPPSPVGA